MTTTKIRPRVLVLGANGATGRALVRALATSHDVTAFVRNETSFEPAVRVAVGDVLEVEDVSRAIDGQDAVVWSIGGRDAIRSLLSGKPGQVRLCEDGTAHVIAAMRRHEVRRLVVISSWGVGDGRSRLPWPFRILLPLMMGHELRDKLSQEKLVTSTDLAWTILRPTVLASGDPARPLRVGERQSFGPSSRVSRGALAALVAGLLGAPDAVGRILDVGT